ncbi:MAG: alpha-xylosidase [[Eubacterium] siraeum]|nr:alpha-xylosidase [[Eubacterium] siraeum]
MKFSDGFWLNKNGYEVKYAEQPYEISAIKNGLQIFAAARYIQNRGQTLEGPCIEVTVTSTQKNVIKVSTVHFKGGLKNQPHFELNEDLGFTPTVTETDNCWEIVSGDTKAVIGKYNYSIEYYYKKKRLTGGSWRSLSVIKEDGFLKQAKIYAASGRSFWEYPETEVTGYIREQLEMSVGEYFYGFGEKFTPFVKNGQTAEMWNSDGGTCSEQSYKSVPFYISSRGYGIFVNSTDRVSFEVCSDTVSKVSFTLPGEKLEYFVIGGESLENVIESYTDLTGKPALPPAYSFGLWLTTSFTTDYDEKTVTSFIDGMEQRSIPLEVFHFDSFWMKEFCWCDFKWDKRQFPDPAAMLKRLKDRGLKICVWINPYIGQRSELFGEAAKKGYLLHNKDGSIFQCDMWQPGLAVVDFTNPKACDWYKGKLRALCEIGVDCIKTDFGERIPTDVCYYDGSDPVSMHNYYTYLYNKAVFELLTDFYGENNACLFARSATAGGQKFPVHWGGDCSANYNSMAETIRGGLSLCLSGFGFYSHDISGFESTATPDIYKRWTAFGLLSSHSRLHGNSTYRVPWLFDEEAVDVLRFFVNLKGRLMPYLWTQAVKTHVKGVPMMRAMVMDYSGDPVCLTLDKQYMLGDNLLVAPILNDEGLGEFYLPKGKWTDIISERVYEGEKFYHEKYDYFSLPCLARPNSIIAFGDFKKGFEYDYLENAEFVVYQPEEDAPITEKICDKDGKEIFSLTAVRHGDELEIGFTETDKKFFVRAAGHEKTAVDPAKGRVTLKL